MVDDPNRRESEDFEDEVRRIARLLWPAAEFSGAANVDGSERDGVFETEECTHLLEVTTLRTKAKAASDIEKLVTLATKLSKRATTRAVRCWFITRDEPTADQRQVADGHRGLVNAMSFAQFQSRLIDARAYLTAREQRQFGSAHEQDGSAVDPKTGKKRAAPDYYIEMQLVARLHGATRSPRELAQDLLAGKKIVILGDYGAGKSMTMLFLYRELRAAYFGKKTARFPVYINLRDHVGQAEPCEILDRHARSIGFSSPAHLVRAWRAGYVHLLLDGFDEVTTASMQGLWRKLQANRFRAMEGVRRLVREHPEQSGIALCGRAHFFDSDAERMKALGLGGAFTEYSLSEFSDEQIREYLERRGIRGAVPQWLPSRPLLVAYLASRGILDEVTAPPGEKDVVLDASAGWDFLLEKIAAREAEIEAGIDGPTVRRILERLATKARACQGGLGPLNANAVISSFEEICGYSPDDRGMMLLQRLPGLGVNTDEEETRSFIDEDFVDACRAGDIMEFIDNPYSEGALASFPLERGIGTLGASISGQKCRARSVTSGKLGAAITKAREGTTQHLICDLVRVSFEAGVRVEDSFFIRGLLIPEMDLPQGLPDTSGVEFQDCFFGRLGIDSDADERHLPRFRVCYIGVLEGRLSERDLPVSRFDGCVIEEFAAETATTDSVLALDLPLGVRVLLTILKKLYEQRGSGRRENALFRGLDHRARRIVPDVLRLLQREGLADCCKRGTDTIWLPDRAGRKRVGRIVASPSASEDPLVVAARSLE